MMDEYSFIGGICSGAFSSVWIGKKDGVEYAVKEFKTDNTGDKYVHLHRRTEVTALNIIHRKCNTDEAKYFPKIEETIVSSGKYYHVMTLFKGTDLCTYMEDNGIDQDMANIIFKKLCIIVQILHKYNISHGDLKPENVIIDIRYGEIQLYLIDFGFAFNFNPSGEKVIQRSIKFGTPLYQSPELMRGISHETSKVDIWALGIIYHELLSNTHPYFYGDMDKEMFFQSVQNNRQNIAKNIEGKEKSIIRRILTYTPELRPNIDQVLALLDEEIQTNN